MYRSLPHFDNDKARKRVNLTDMLPGQIGYIVSGDNITAALVGLVVCCFDISMVLADGGQGGERKFVIAALQSNEKNHSMLTGVNKDVTIHTSRAWYSGTGKHHATPNSTIIVGLLEPDDCVVLQVTDEVDEGF